MNLNTNPNRTHRIVGAIGASLRHTTITIEPTPGQSASAAEQDA